MITLFSYGPSQNAYKVRLLLNQLRRDYRTVDISIFEGESRTPEFLEKNPMGTVPVLELEDGTYLPESNAILAYLAEGTEFFAKEPLERAQTLRWMFFEQEYVQSSIATLRHRTLTGKLDFDSPITAERRRLGERVLTALNNHLGNYDFLAGNRYSIADISVFSYGGLADDAGYRLADYPAVKDWTSRIRSQSKFLDDIIPYSVDPYSSRELG
ncbi:glutathione S-transferase family protein [Pelagibius sp. Alg239-R121]|uniref:glutathione S-transferase family protein n=1 Tax=Pelagibius sp. Alg239-R121 TaxID=2993448 RepID=UPI0024A63E80|nr:glutathione S-transferase family protein [Pelagibius sp. Alg239-R121]